MAKKVKRIKVNAWQEEQKRKGRRAFTAFLDEWIIEKIFARAKAKNMSAADYLCKYLPAMWAKVGTKPGVTAGTNENSQTPK